MLPLFFDPAFDAPPFDDLPEEHPAARTPANTRAPVSLAVLCCEACIVWTLRDGAGTPRPPGCRGPAQIAHQDLSGITGLSLIARIKDVNSVYIFNLAT
jgi:hypothetical protein